MTRLAVRLLTVLALVATGLLAPAVASSPATTAQAANLAFFDPGNIISDGVFYDFLSMNANDVQAFLNAKGSACQPGTDGTPCLKDYSLSTGSRPADGLCNGYQGAANESAATIIVKVSVSCGVSPRVMLVLLQKEMGLVTGTKPTAKKYERAAGYACPDSANGGCDPAFAGLMNQLYKSGWQYKRYQAAPKSYSFVAGQNNTIGWHPNTGCGSSSVYIANQATAGLYNYTPYRPNQAALNAGYGSGDSCSSYGNRNFWNYFTDWFGSTQSNGGGAIYAKYQEVQAKTPLGAPKGTFFCVLRAGGCYQEFASGAIYWTQWTGAHPLTGAFRDKWNAMGRENAGLGFPTTDQACGLPNGGCYQQFEWGALYSSASTPPQAVMGAIRTVWSQTGAEGGWLGYPTTTEAGGLVRGGSYQQFQTGAVYWSPASGAHAVTGVIRDRWRQLNSEFGPLGYPMSSTICGLKDAGCYQQFEGGALYSSASTPTTVVFGGIRTAWSATGAENGPLGYPTTTEAGGLIRGGSYQQFQNGAVYWSPASGAHRVTGAIRDRWNQFGSENGGLGYPTSEPMCGLKDTGCYQEFQGGALYSNAVTASQPIWGGIRSAWSATGAENGPLGYPTNVEAGDGRGGTWQQFQNGAVHWSPATGAHVVTGAIRDRWTALGAGGSGIGYPITNTICGLKDSGCYQLFQGGSMYSSASTLPARVVFGAIRVTWNSTGLENGPLGYPTTDETGGLVRGGSYQQFQGGAVYWSPASGAQVVSGPIRDRWNALGAESGSLGYPASAQRSSSGLLVQQFERGTLTYDPATGVVTGG